MKRKFSLSGKWATLIGLLTIALMLSFGATALLAGSSSDSMMPQMMSKDAMDQMAMMEEQMLGTEQYQQMQVLMSKMMSGTLTPEEQKDMIAAMQDPATGTGMCSMMMRSMMDQMMKTHGSGDVHGMMGGGQGMMDGKSGKDQKWGMDDERHGMWSDRGGKMDGGYMMGSFNSRHSSFGFAIACGITILLLWVLMIALIVYLFQLITRKPPTS